MNNESYQYTGSKFFEDGDEFKAPNLNFNELKEYKELENKDFTIENGTIANITKAIQAIQFSLDEKGGEIKSEVAMGCILSDEAPRYFYVDNTFAIFLRESGQTLPYFAGRIENITKF
ncbi:MAG: hypothetical protein FWC53_02260 [Firmicutes bacterium]|nr:hypothetical protein [Bacillota bacterium]